MARGRLAWCLLCGTPAGVPVPSREAGAAKRVPKETLRFPFCDQHSYLVYRPEHGRTTRRT